MTEYEFVWTEFHVVLAARHNVDLRGADLSNANLAWANLTGANLSGANLSGANLSGADLRGAKLRGADLSDTDLSNADLAWANLRDADLTGTRLTGANLVEADLSGARLVDTVLDPNTWVRNRAAARPHMGRIMYRTEISKYAGDNIYEPGQTYAAPWMSWCTVTECHPGLYAYLTLAQCRTRHPHERIIAVYAREGDYTIAAKDGTARCAKFRVLGYVDYPDELS